MASKQSRSRNNKNKREYMYRGAALAGVLIRFLNTPSKDPDIPVLRRIIELCHALIDQPTDIGGALVQGLAVPDVERELGKLLTDFKGVPHISLMPPDSLIARWELSPNSPYYKCNAKRAYPPIDALLTMVGDGSIANLRACFCGKFFYRKFAHQKFCTDTCRIKWHLDSPESQEKRRKRQREYYHDNLSPKSFQKRFRRAK